MQGQDRIHIPLWATAVALAIAATLVFAVPRVLMLLFAAVLLAVLLRGLASLIARHTSLESSTSFALVVTLCTLVLVSALWLVAASLQDQLGRFAEQLPKAWQGFEAWLGEQPWGPTARRFVPGMGNAEQLLGGSQATGFVSSTFGVLADMFVLLFVGFYLAAEPDTYITGFLRLLPPSRRARTCEVLSTIGTTLRRWMVGRFLLMSTNGVITWLVLWTLGIPLPFVLGLLSGILNFVPNIGPIVAAIPAVLLAFTVGPWPALYVAIFFFSYQMLDGYVFTPLVQRRTVSLPPALTITAQILLGVLLGTMGVLLAVPLTAVMLVMVKMLYVSDVLGEEVTLADHSEHAA